MEGEKHDEESSRARKAEERKPPDARLSVNGGELDGVDVEEGGGGAIGSETVALLATGDAKDHKAVGPVVSGDAGSLCGTPCEMLFPCCGLVEEVDAEREGLTEDAELSRAVGVRLGRRTMCGAFCGTVCGNWCGDAEWPWWSPLLWFQTVMFTWVNPMIVRAAKRALEMADLVDIPAWLKTRSVAERMREEWGRELEQSGWDLTAGEPRDGAGHRKPNLLAALFRVVWIRFFMIAVLQLTYYGLNFMAAIALERLITLMEAGGHESSEGAGRGADHGKWPWSAGGSEEAIFWAVLVSFCTIAQPLVKHQWAMSGLMLGMYTRSCLVTLIHSKLVHLPTASDGTVSTLVGTDSNRMVSAAWQLHSVWIAPGVLVGAVSLIWRLLGWATAPSLGIALLLIPINGYIMHVFSQTQDQLMSRQQARMDLLGESLDAIETVKYNAWEGPVASRIVAAREKELVSVSSYNRNLARIMTVIMGMTPLMAASSFATYVAGRKLPLTAQVAFPALFLFDLVMWPLLDLPFAIGEVVGAHTSINRIATFLLRPQVPALVRRPEAPPAGGPVGWIRGATFAYPLPVHDISDEDPDGDSSADNKQAETGKGEKGEKGAGFLAEARAPLLDGEEAEEEGGGMVPVLRDVELEIRKGELLAVVGDVGAGKSSLLLALLGELVAVEEDGGGGVRPSRGELDARLFGSVSYVPQTPWVRSATVMDNITGFAADVDRARYEVAVEGASLKRDLEILPHGDQTMCGENGVSLSGGQRARIALARALYMDADTLLLDDPLSAVDAHVGEELFGTTLVHRLAGRTRVLVTHQLQFLDRCDRILVLAGGRVQHLGTFAELQASGMHFSSLLDAKSAAKSTGSDGAGAGAAGAGAGGAIGPRVSLGRARTVSGDQTSEDGGNEESNLRLLTMMESVASAGKEEEDDVDGVVLDPPTRLPSPRSRAKGPLSPEFGPAPDGDSCAGRRGVMAATASFDSDDGAEGLVLPRAAFQPSRSRSATTPSTPSPPDPSSSSENLVVEEERYRGSIGWPTLEAYAGSLGGPCFVGMFGVVSVLLEVVLMGTNVWVALWAGSNASTRPSTTVEIAHAGSSLGLHGEWVWVWGTVALGALSVAVGFVRNESWFSATTRASRALHHKALEGLFRSPLSFFFSNPKGRILARFSKDLSVVDQELPDMVSDAIACLLELLSRLATIAWSAPYVLTALPVLLVGYGTVARSYRRAARELKRLDSLAASPLHSHFTEVCAGLVPIRAYGAGGRETERFEQLMDAATRARFATRSADRWLGTRVESLGAGLGMVAATIAALRVAGAIGGNPTLLGLALTTGMSLTGTINWLTRTATQSEAELARAERLVHLSNLPPEPPLHAKGEVRAWPTAWPAKGGVEFRSVQFRYRAGLPHALHDVSFHVKPGERAAFVGRTGAGKSTVATAALLRGGDITRGSICIDGVDTRTLGLRTLRAGVGTLLQTPHLLSGSLRETLSPWGPQKDPEGPVPWDDTPQPPPPADDALLAMLRRVGLGAWTASLPEGLETQVRKGGENLSLGQRQLLCMARTLLAKPRVVVLDEATASISPAEDLLVQRTLRTALGGATLLTIAHRLPTVIDYDTIHVVDAGRIAEAGSPAALLSRPGHFSSLVDDTGPRSSRILRQRAAAAGPP